MLATLKEGLYQWFCLEGYACTLHGRQGRQHGGPHSPWAPQTSGLTQCRHPLPTHQGASAGSGPANLWRPPPLPLHHGPSLLIPAQPTSTSQKCPSTPQGSFPAILRSKTSSCQWFTLQGCITSQNLTEAMALRLPTAPYGICQFQANPSLDGVRGQSAY